MKEKDLPIDRSKHTVYTKNAKKCVQNLLRRCYDEKEAAEVWEKVQLQYCEFLKEEPALKDLKITTSIYDPILIFAWYAVATDKPPWEEIQREVYKSFFGSFDKLGKVFDLNRPLDNRLANRIFKKANDMVSAPHAPESKAHRVCPPSLPGPFVPGPFPLFKPLVQTRRFDRRAPGSRALPLPPRCAWQAAAPRRRKPPLSGQRPARTGPRPSP